MADYVSAHITLGGSVPVQCGNKLCQAIANERLALDWCESSFVPQSAQDLLEARTTIEGALVLRLYDEQAAWGQFDALEQFLVRHEIAFDRFNEGKYEISPGLVRYRPGWGTFRSDCDAQGRVMVPAEPLAQLVPRFQRICEHLDRAACAPAREELDATLEALQRALPPVLPPLTALEFRH